MCHHGLECDPTKIEDVKSWPVPDCLKSVRQFLGFVGYYRRFIPKFADVATPLVTLTGKDVPFVWDSSCSAAFAALRATLMNAPILAFPTETGLYVLDTDTSNFGLGGVLSQVQNDEERVVAYCSCALRPSQRRYCTTKREMLAAVAMCIQFRSYLRGARFSLLTDKKSLVRLHRFKDTEGMMCRWLHALQQFQFSIVHRPGKDHGNADGLSCAREVHRAHFYSYWSPRPAANSYSCLTMLPYLGRTRTLTMYSAGMYENSHRSLPPIIWRHDWTF